MISVSHWRKNLQYAKARALLVLVGLLCSPVSLALDLPHITAIKRFIEAVDSGDKQNVLDLTLLPIQRATPIPPVETQADFLDRYDQIFDEELVEIILHSNPETDWADMAWRGIMLADGLIWLDSDGKLRAVNYQSIVEASLQARLIEEDRDRIHDHLKEYQSLVLDWETNQHRVRIDELDSGQYRLAVWPAGSDPGALPEQILDNGEIHFDGSGGNHYFEFHHADHHYICYVDVLGSEDPNVPGDFSLYQQGSLVFNEPVVQVYH